MGGILQVGFAAWQWGVVGLACAAAFFVAGLVARLYQQEIRAAFGSLFQRAANLLQPKGRNLDRHSGVQQEHAAGVPATSPPNHLLQLSGESASREQVALLPPPKIQHIVDRKETEKKFNELLEVAEAFWFCGPLDLSRARSFIKWINSRHALGDTMVQCNIFNTSVAFYRSEGAEELIAELVKLDKAHRRFTNYHFFHCSSPTHLRIRMRQDDGSDQFQSLLIFGDETPRENAILIHGSWVPPPEVPHSCIFEINSVEQTEIFEEIEETYSEYLDPLKDGWFRPVLPPRAGDVLDALQDINLEWFQETATSLVKRAGSEGYLKITWLITERSLEQAKLFKKWLNWLRAHQELPIERVLIIDFGKFQRNENHYAETIRGICDYLPNTSTVNYKIYVLDKERLDHPIRDFALIKLHDAEYLQNSRSYENDAATEFRFLVYFTRDGTEVSDYRRKFDNLVKRTRSYEYEGLEKLEKHILTVRSRRRS